MEDGSEPRRYTVVEAADLLDMTPDGVRKRIHKQQLLHTKDPDTGRYYVFLTPADIEKESSSIQSRDELVDSLERRIESLERQLDNEREANSENRRLLAAALERIPAIESPPNTQASPEARGSPQTASEEPSDTRGPKDEEKRSLWRRIFG